MSLSLNGKNVLVTGGSRGLGACIVQRFAAEGANVVINYVSAADRAEALAKEVREQYGVRVLVICADVGSDRECQRLVKETIEGLGGLDVIVSNAVGFVFSLGSLSEGKVGEGANVGGWV